MHLFTGLRMFFCGGPIYSQWKKGTVVLTNQAVFTGEISYQPSQDIVLFRSADELVVLPAPRIQLFRYYDEATNINRQFVSLKLDDYKKFKLFEVVLQGPVKVLRCSKRWSPVSAHDEIEDYNYFTWDGNQLEPIGKFEYTVYPKLVAEQPAEVKAFVSNSHLHLNAMRSAILIIKEYNRVVQNRQFMARAY